MMKRIFILSFLFTVIPILLTGCGDNIFESVADKDSHDSCRFNASKELDKGNFDKVIELPCSDSMQKGGAYFGKAGFDVKDVINNFSEAEDNSSPLNIYLGALTGSVSDTTIDNLDSAKTAFGEVDTSEEGYSDAQFYTSIVGAVKSVSIMKLIVDVNGDGLILSECDINNNGTPDEADAASCSLLSTPLVSQQCSKASAAIENGDITFSDKKGTYKGLTITITGTATATCSDTYKKLFYLNSTDSNYYLTLTSSSSCTGSDNKQWPCPVETNNQPLGVVTAIGESISSAVDSLASALSLDKDISQSIKDIQQSCGGSTCTEADISNYLQTLTASK